MRCLLTGGAGFIGTHLAQRLLVDGHEVVLLDNLHRRSERATDAFLSSCDFRMGDIRDPHVVAEAMRDVEVVYHLAAQSQVITADRDPEYAMQTNVDGTVHVVEAAREAGARRIVFSSSREVYGEPERLPVAETDPPNPKNTYGRSKALAERHCQDLGQTGRLSTVIVRLSNVYGPGDRGRVIPIWLDRALAGEGLEVYGGQQLLDLVWIDLVVEALLAATAITAEAMPINIGTGKGTRIHDVALRILQATGSGSQVIVRPAREIEVERFVADVRRMTATLGIVPPGDPLAGIDSMAATMRHRDPASAT